MSDVEAGGRRGESHCCAVLRRRGDEAEGEGKREGERLEVGAGVQGPGAREGHSNGREGGRDDGVSQEEAKWWAGRRETAYQAVLRKTTLERVAAKVKVAPRTLREWRDHRYWRERVQREEVARAEANQELLLSLDRAALAALERHLERSGAVALRYLHLRGVVLRAAGEEGKAGQAGQGGQAGIRFNPLNEEEKAAVRRALEEVREGEEGIEEAEGEAKMQHAKRREGRERELRLEI